MAILERMLGGKSWITALLVLMGAAGAAQAWPKKPLTRVCDLILNSAQFRHGQVIQIRGQLFNNRRHGSTLYDHRSGDCIEIAIPASIYYYVDDKSMKPSKAKRVWRIIGAVTNQSKEIEFVAWVKKDECDDGICVIEVMVVDVREIEPW